MSDEELKMVHALAEHAGLTASDIVRQLVRKAHAEMVGTTKKGRK